MWGCSGHGFLSATLGLTRRAAWWSQPAKPLKWGERVHSSRLSYRLLRCGHA